jgi:uncharacterized protein (TIGR03437 family)
VRLFRAFIVFSAAFPICASSSLIEANRGQFPSDVRFLTRNTAVSTAITSSGITFENHHQRLSLRLNKAFLTQCAPASKVESEAHYPVHTPPISNVPEYSSVLCRDVYPGIDWVFRTTNGSIEHDWNVAAGADAGAIVLLMDKTADASVAFNGDLQLHSGALSVTWRAPQSYQDVAGTRRSVETSYVIRGRRITLKLGPHRRDLPLVIDPVIDFSYIVNGSADDRGCQVGLDGAGNIYLAGLTLSPDFETTTGAAFGTPVPSPGGDYQVFVRKLSPDGSKVIYSTYLGVAAFNSSHPLGMKVDQSGAVYLAANVFGNGVGVTTAIDPRGTVEVYKLATGGDHLIYGTTLLAGLEYTAPVALGIDSAGNAYVGASNVGIDVCKIDPAGKTQLYHYHATMSDYSGGLADLAVGSDGTVYVAGNTAMGGLVTTPGAWKTSVANSQNFHGFLIRLKADGSGPIYSTFIGGDYYDSVSALAIDASGAAYVGGQTISNGQYLGLQGTSLGVSQASATTAFVLKLNPQGSAPVFASLLPFSSVNAIAADASGNVYAGAWGVSGVFMSKIDATGTKLLYFSNIPASPALVNSSSMPIGMALDSSGGSYVTGAIADIKIPDAAAPARLSPNAFLLKVDPNPAQSDLWLEPPPNQAFVPGSPASLSFTIHNSGPSAAENVIFSGGLQGGGIIAACTTGGTGVCSVNPLRAFFDSIPAGGSQTVELQLNSSGGPVTNLVAVASVSSVTSDVNQDNNVATATGTTNDVPLYIQGTYGPSNLNVVYTATGGSPFPGYATPNSQVQIYWPSPQKSTFGAVRFERWVDGSTDNPRTFTATPPQLAATALFVLLTTPYFSPDSVANAGSYAANGVSPGEFVALVGFNLAQTGTAQLQNGRLPTTLGNTSVTFDGTPAPLVYASSGQINAIVPYEVAGKSATTITVQTASPAYSVTVPVVQAVPALFTANASGSGQASALNQDGSTNSPANPANPGDVIVLFGTGEGLVSPVPGDGTISSAPAPVPQLQVTVTIGGMPAEVRYAGAAPGLAAGVIQINAVIPAGITPTHHVPVTWNAGSYSSQSGVTIAVNDSPGPAYVFQPGTDDPSLTPITIAPSRIAADSGGSTVTVLGAGFALGMIVRWNNQPRPTQFIGPANLQVTLTGNDLESPQLGSIAVWDATQTTQITQAAPLLVYLPLLNHDLVYDTARDKIYVAVTAAQVPQGSCIAVINPETGRTERFYPLNIEPTKLAVSGDSHYLYVALGNIVRRINLDTWVAELDIPLGQDASFGAREVSSMITLPGANNSLAVSFFKTGLSPPYLGTAIFDNAQIRPVVTPSYDGPLYLFGGPTAGLLYGGDNEGNFYTLAVDTSGVKVAQAFAGLLGADGDSVYAGGLVYDGWGEAVDPSVPRVVSTYDNAGLIVPLLDLKQVLILGGMTPVGYSGSVTGQILTLNDGGSGRRLWSLPMPVQIGLNHGPMFRWGTNGFALRESQLFNAAAPGVDLFRFSLGQ